MNTTAKFAVMAAVLGTTFIGLFHAAPAPIPQDSTKYWSAPDNDPGQSQNKDVTPDPVGEETILTLTVLGDPKDETFTVEIYRVTPAGLIEILDTIEFTEGNTPPITIPKGAKARVQDDPDGNSQGPHGSYELTKPG